VTPTDPTAQISRARETLRWVTLPEIRQRMRSRSARVVAIGTACLFALVSMLAGEMIVLQNISGPAVFQVLSSPPGGQWWNFPQPFAILPWGTVALPFLPTVCMALVSAGVGIGVGVGFVMIAPLVRRSPTPARPVATGAAAGVAPAIAGLATLGACCCVGCVGATGVSIVAAASGVSIASLYLNDWYIGLFQVGVVFVSLLATESILERVATHAEAAPRFDARFLAGAVLRVCLMIAGITWSLAMLVEWGELSPLVAPPGVIYHWTFEHQLLALTAIAAGLFPREFTILIRRIALRPVGLALRVALAFAAFTWGAWVPPSLTALGLGGFLNELFGVLGLPGAWGAIAPDSAPGAALLFHWSFQHLLLSGFAMALAVAPTSATQPLWWTVSAEPSPTPGARVRGPPYETPTGAWAAPAETDSVE